MKELDEIEFVLESNKIEGEYSVESMEFALGAWLIIRNKKELQLNYILDAHAVLLYNLSPQIAGRLRDCEVTVGGIDCPSYWLVPNLLDNWFLDHADASTEEDIKEAHIRFEKIHPFEDGNGRIGRMIMNWQRLKAGLEVLVIHEGEEQQSYYGWFKE